MRKENITHHYVLRHAYMTSLMVTFVPKVKTKAKRRVLSCNFLFHSKTAPVGDFSSISFKQKDSRVNQKAAVTEIKTTKVFVVFLQLFISIMLL